MRRIDEQHNLVSRYVTKINGQLFVVVSRVKTKRGLKVLCCDKDDKYTNVIKMTNTLTPQETLGTKKFYFEYKSPSCD